MNSTDHTEHERIPGKMFDVILAIACVLLFLLLLVLSVIHFNHERLFILLYIGWAVILFGFMAGGKASQDYFSRPRPASDDNGDQKASALFRGTYKIIRHPIYGSFIMIIAGLMMIIQYWIGLVAGVVLILLLYLAMLREEEHSLRKFGIAYRAYMKKVPRLNVLRRFVKRRF
jgi:protein-S-isoprenylcysteine O-methyltransferase Ste14